jgi:hypothetical protein
MTEFIFHLLIEKYKFGVFRIFGELLELFTQLFNLDRP